MNRATSIRAAALALLLCLVPIATAMAAKSKPKQKSRSIPKHFSELKFEELDFAVPEAERYRHVLANGVEVFIAEDHTLPLIDVSMDIRVGSFLEGKKGVAEMTGTLLRVGGAGEMSAEEFDERADFLAAQLSSYTGDVRGGVLLNCITSTLDETLDLLFAMLRTPRFQQDRIEIEKDDLLEGMKQRNDSPQSISRREWQWLMRGREHFTSQYMTRADVEAITRDDLVDFHKKYWRPENVVIAVSGDVDPEEVLAKLNRRFEGWKVEGPEIPWPPPEPDHSPIPGVYYVEKDIPQGRVVIGHQGIKRKSWEDKEPFTVSLMNDVLGGGSAFTSRLIKRIRSDEGLSYSAGSSFDVGRLWPGIFRMGFQSKSPTVAFAAQIAIEEVNRMRTEPVSDNELRLARRQRIETFPQRFESPSQIATVFAEDAFLDRPHSYWKSYRENLEAVTAKDIQEAARKYLDPDKLVFLIVGDWETIAKGDPDGKATMAQFGKATQIPLRDPMTLEPMEQVPEGK